MTVQARLDIDNVNLVMSGDTYAREDETISQIIGRAVPLLHNTVMARNGAEWLPLQVVDPAGVPATCTTGVLGTDPVGFQAVTTGDFSILVDGATVVVTGCDFSDISTPLDTPATLTCGVNGSLLAAWQAVTGGAAGEFGCVVNGVAQTWIGFDFAGIAALADIPAIINAQTVPNGLRCLYDVGGNIFSFVTTATGAVATLGFLTNPPAGMTDISGVTGNLFLNGDAAPAVIVNGTGGTIGVTIESVINTQAAGRFSCYHDYAANTMVFVSPTTGEDSSIGPLSDTGGAGADISGAGFLNGRTGVAVLATATGFDDVNLPAGIYIGEDILAATVAAAHVHNCPILVGGTATINGGELVLEGGLTLATEIPTLHKQIGDVLLSIGLTPEACIDIAGHENP